MLLTTDDSINAEREQRLIDDFGSATRPDPS
jgi:hypothetical protein